ncbi:MAG: hypothetical protein OXF26_08805 [Alphaproteobacteria bacterium]|nr:hypothetical protein [Alphaproteobacteria bacterium]MCY4320144.1 hypothetical protein [Alphaproteobacteria bacterium]
MNRKTDLRFATLGPAGTNHEFVTRNYLAFHGLVDAELILVDDFFEGLAMMNTGRVEFMVQVAVHPDCAAVVAKAHFDYGIHVIDCFIAPGKELGILTRAEVADPRTLALQPATSSYADLSAWPDQIPTASIMRVAEGLLNGDYDSGLTALELVERHPGRFRVDAVIGAVDDPWLLYGRKRVAVAGLVAWPESPASRWFRSPIG